MIASIYLFLNLGGGEVFLVILVMLMFFGSDKLPEIAKGLGKGLRELNDAKNTVQEEIKKHTGGLADEINKHTADIQDELNKAGEGMRKQLEDAGNAVKESTKSIGDTLQE